MDIIFSEVPVVIMAGGKGTRMRPYSDILPKPLLGFHGKTMIENVIDNYYQVGFRKFYLVLCYKAELIKLYIESINLPIDVNYIYEKTPLGTVGGLQYLKGIIKTDFILCNCDNLGEFDYEKGFQTHLSAHADITIFAKKQHYRIPFGIIQSDNEGVVSGINEKPYYDFWASTGVHIVNCRALELIKCDEAIDMPELINKITMNGKVVISDVGDAIWTDMSI